MASSRERLLDDTGWRILDLLHDNARIPFSELGRRVGLSPPAVAERVRRMEDAGLITGYRAEIGLEKLGFPISAIIRVAAPEERCARLKALVQGLPEVLECHHVTGADAYVLKVVASSVKHLESVIEAIGRHGAPATAVVLSTPVSRGAGASLRRRRGGAVVPAGRSARSGAGRR